MDNEEKLLTIYEECVRQYDPSYIMEEEETHSSTPTKSDIKPLDILNIRVNMTRNRTTENLHRSIETVKGGGQNSENSYDHGII